MTVGIRDVAKKANVSVATVSHVLNKTRYVAPKTQDRVSQAIRELGYYKNLHAQRLARGRSDCFGLIISDIENPFFPGLIRSFETNTLEKGYEVLLWATNYDPERTQVAVRKMIENMVRGVAVMTSQPESDIAEELVKNGIPVVFLERGRVGRSISNIRINHMPAVVDAVNHLYDWGHRDVAIIAGPPNHFSANRYRDAFIEGLKSKGLKVKHVLEGNNGVDGGYGAVQAMLHASLLPTALICSNDLTALGALTALREAGLQIPEDISVIGADDIPFARLASPQLTTLRLSREELGRLAFESLERMLRSKQRRGVEYVLETQFIARQSTGPAKDNDRQPQSLSDSEGLPAYLRK